MLLLTPSSVAAVVLTLVSAQAASVDKRWLAPSVSVGSAIYTGVYNETTGVQYFKGIPYAAPPVGK
jgi:carboxylesterase type B